MESNTGAKTGDRPFSVGTVENVSPIQINKPSKTALAAMANNAPMKNSPTLCIVGSLVLRSSANPISVSYTHLTLPTKA